jgi:hypothetical protein
MPPRRDDSAFERAKKKAHDIIQGMVFRPPEDDLVVLKSQIMVMKQTGLRPSGDPDSMPHLYPEDRRVVDVAESFVASVEAAGYPPSLYQPPCAPKDPNKGLYFLYGLMAGSGSAIIVISMILMMSK